MNRWETVALGCRYLCTELFLSVHVEINLILNQDHFPFGESKTLVSFNQHPLCIYEIPLDLTAPADPADPLEEATLTAIAVSFLGFFLINIRWIGRGVGDHNWYYILLVRFFYLHADLETRNLLCQ